MEMISSLGIDLINDIWNWVESYEPDIKIRGDTYIDDKQLMNKMKEFEELSQLMDLIENTWKPDNLKWIK